VKLWRASDGVRLETLSQPQGEVASLAFTPDGAHVIAAGRDKRIHLWKLASLDAPAINPPVHARFAHETPVVTIALSADGRRLLTTAEDRSLKSWSVPDLVLEHDFARQPDVVAAVVAADDGRFLAGRMDGSLEVFDVAGLQTVGGGKPAVASRSAATTSPAASPAADTTAAKLSESEPNDTPAEAQPLAAPAFLSGAIQEGGDADCFRFTARAGLPLLLEVIAASGTPRSRLDSRVEVLDRNGAPVEQVVLQAVRDSWLTFRGKNSNASDDFPSRSVCDPYNN
jgi:hypothetical protein